MIDSLADSMLLDPTVVMLGGIPVRQAGAITIPLSQIAEVMKPYTQHTIERDSVFTFDAGQSVFELVDPAGAVYTMQSYSVQKVAETEATLPTLGTSLMLATGWTFRTRTLSVALVLRSMDNQATVVQDDNDNTYLQSQP